MNTLFHLLSYFVGFALVLPSLMVHEVAHGCAALWCGDRTAKWAGRLSFNPLRHIDPVGTVAVPAFLILVGSAPFGWAKPVPINLSRTRNPRQALWITALAGPLSNLVLAVAGALLVRLFASLGLAWLTAVTFRYVVFTNLVLMVFNLFPIPPLDGSRVVSAALPYDLAVQYNSLERYGFFLILALFNFVPAFERLLSTLVWSLAKILL